MSLLSKKAVVLLLTAAASLGALNAHAAKATASDKAPAQEVSMLGGKFKFSLPKGFIANPLPAGDAAAGTAGATGTMYTNQATKTVVIAAENTIPGGANVKDNDSQFLDSAASDFATEQAHALPDFTKLSEKSLTQKGTGLGLRQIDSTATQGGGKTLDTTVMAASNTRMAIVQVISRLSDNAGHETLVKQIVSGK
ncbi:hypothetical protein SAMN04489798_3628 [Pseudomonas arsenicoxydans]|jgi:hypothetical protein|uniref:Uncharacterized protein n=1 Tax=Pseudomonas arsenicoxydans TaxID=702115 RepID=A0A1H0LQS2_9PSED|nr:MULTISPECIES: hypothetical protein [Pseudomonas]MCS3838288.1 hypothetical protein [Pseudomonas sp. JAI111]QZP30755.1 hypothetical protein K5K95_21465 [Pseudomonas sp. DR48]SDO70433.1 hypothetical protein SAMN04489798_3628 [Pseudomonas arsenicoxydans]